MKQGQLTVSSGLKGRREGEDAHRCSPRPRRRSTCSRTPASMPARPRTLHSPSCACRWIPRRRVRTSGAGRRPRRRRAGRVRPGRWPAPSSCRADPSPRAHSARRRGGGRERRPRRPDLRATGASRAARGVRGSAALAAGSREGQSRTMSSSSSELLQSAAQDRRRASQRLSGGCRASTACGAAGSRPTGSRGEPQAGAPAHGDRLLSRASTAPLLPLPGPCEPDRRHACRAESKVGVGRGGRELLLRDRRGRMPQGDERARKLSRHRARGKQEARAVELKRKRKSEAEEASCPRHPLQAQPCLMLARGPPKLAPVDSLKRALRSSVAEQGEVERAQISQRQRPSGSSSFRPWLIAMSSTRTSASSRRTDSPAAPTRPRGTSRRCACRHSGGGGASSAREHGRRRGCCERDVKRERRGG